MFRGQTGAILDATGRNWAGRPGRAARRGKREEEHLDEIRAESPNLPPVSQPKLYDVVTA
jgi:hypothetical protein